MLFGTKMARTLKDHEDVCNIRYQAIDEKLAKLEQKVDEIRQEIDGFKTFIVKLAVRTGLSLFVVVCGAVFVIKL
jgi:uncharacterized coiled-coil DUF342 family protein